MVGVSAVLLVACVGPAGVPAHSGATQEANPGDVANAAVVVGARAATDRQEVRFGWDVRLDDEHVQWRECVTAKECGGALHTGAASRLLGVETVGTADVADPAGKTQRVEVKRMRFRPLSATRALPAPADGTSP